MRRTRILTFGDEEKVETQITQKKSFIIFDKLLVFIMIYIAVPDYSLGELKVKLKVAFRSNKYGETNLCN